MNRIAGRHEKGMPVRGREKDPLSGKVNESVLPGKRSALLPWLVSGICIFAVLYGTSDVALFWLPPFAGVDMRSQLSADYSGWAFLVLQPVDPSVIDEIKQERGLPEQIIIDGSFWPTSNGTNITSSMGSGTPVSTSMVTFETPLSSATAIQPPHTSTPVPTNPIVTPEPVVTLQAIKTSVPTNVVNPANNSNSKPRKTPKPEKTSKPPKEPKH